MTDFEACPNRHPESGNNFVSQQIERGIIIESDDLESGIDTGISGCVLYEKTDRGWQAIFHSVVVNDE